MGKLEHGFSQPECNALTTTLWDIPLSLWSSDPPKPVGRNSDEKKICSKGFIWIIHVEI